MIMNKYKNKEIIKRLENLKAEINKQKTLWTNEINKLIHIYLT